MRVDMPLPTVGQAEARLRRVERTLRRFEARRPPRGGAPAPGLEQRQALCRAERDELRAIIDAARRFSRSG